MNLVGLDIGGTRSRIGLVSEDGRLLERASAPTRAEEGPHLFTETIVNLIHSILGGAALDAGHRLAIGIGITGPVDIYTGIISNPHTLAGLPPTNIIEPIKVAFPHATFAVDNDANAAALGEWWTGAGRNSKRLAMVTIGTGIGVSFVVDGVVSRRWDGRHGEAGHQVLDPSGPLCYCGARGCWEALASGAALKRRMGAAQDISDPVAKRAIIETARWIGLGLVNICASFCPDRIVVGGGISERFPTIIEPIEGTLLEYNSMIPTDVPVYLASNGDNAGILGAALLSLRQTLDGGDDFPAPHWRGGKA